MRLIVGLGNPGAKYQGTRHNVGFRVIDELARRGGITVSRRRFSGQVGGGRIGEHRVVLLKPTTYMNLSGQAVRAAMVFHRLGMEDLLVVVDDLSLPLGRLRVRGQGSAGGHHGLSSIIQELGDDSFCRLRVGIGQARGGQMVDHVLSAFSPEEEAVVGPAVERAADAVECWLAKGPQEAMNRFNRPEDASSETDAPP